MFETTYTFTVLSEDPIPGHVSLESVLEECFSGEYVLGDERYTEREVSEAKMARLLIAAGCGPEFFRLNDDGTSMDEDDDYIDNVAHVTILND